MEQGNVHTQAPDHELAAAWKAGDGEAFAAVYSRYSTAITLLCRRYCRDAHLAQDLMQETFLRASGALDRLDVDRIAKGGSLRPWLSTIARNLCLDHGRKASRISLEEVDEASDARISSDPTGETVAMKLRNERLAAPTRAALAVLHPRDRQLVQLRVLEEWSYEEIATIDPAAPHVLRNHVFRALAKLRHLLSPLRDDVRDLGLVAAFACALRRMRLRRADLAHSNGSLWLTEGAIAAIGLLVAAGVGSSLPGQTPGAAEIRTTSSAPSARPAITRTATGERESVVSPVSSTPKEGGASRSSDDPITFDVDTKKREDAAGPAETTSRLEVRGPDGQLWFSRESKTQCDMPRTTRPDVGPVSAYC